MLKCQKWLCGLITEVCGISNQADGCETMRHLSDLTHGVVRGPLEEKGVVKIT